eukprot:Nk52_evm29s250 gene=Nk52_evmTU29s250
MSASQPATSFYDFKVKDLKKKDFDLSTLKSKYVLIINVASKCGFTKQYAGLEKMYEKYKNQGLEIIGFPCNQFMGQEPGTNEEIAQFCSLTYSVTFPIMDKVDVNGDNTHPLYAFLKKAKPGVFGTTAVKWNFTKFLVDKDGTPLKRYGSTDTPEDIEKDIEKLLKGEKI